MYENIKSELAKYYFEELPNLADEHRAKVFEEMDKFAEQHEGASSYFLKAKMKKLKMLLMKVFQV